MDSQLLQIIWSILAAVGVATLSLIAWGIKKLVSTTFENTVAIKVLDKHIETLIRGYGRIDKMEQDLNTAHNKIRELKGTT